MSAFFLLASSLLGAACLLSSSTKVIREVLPPDAGGVGADRFFLLLSAGSGCRYNSALMTGSMATFSLWAKFLRDECASFTFTVNDYTGEFGFGE